MRAGIREHQEQDLETAVSHILEEARMLIPGIQGLFGFQLIAVFTERFAEGLAPPEQRLHLAALVLTAVSFALATAPATYHRIVEPRSISGGFARYASRLLAAAMVPLMVGMALDVHLIARLVLGDVGDAAAVAGVLLVLFAGLWFVYPALHRRRP
jgi:hypothetical protein